MYVKKQFRQLEIYGITGRKGHGKDTFATQVVKANEDMVRARSKVTPKQTFYLTHFAETLKTMSVRIFGLTREQMYDPLLKEVPFLLPVDMDLFVPQMRNETGLASIQPAGKIACSPREIMQFLGTDYVRKTQDDYWVQRTMVLASNQRRVLIPDTRFPNEANAVRANGGRVIKIVRLGVADSGDAHASETEIDKIDPDLLLMVKTGDLSIVQRVAGLIAQGKFKAALKYDWRNAEKAMKAYASGTSLEAAARLLGADTKDPYVLKNLLEYYDKPKRGRQKDPFRVPHQIIAGVISKWCSVCSSHKALAEFNRASKAWDGLAGLCRGCAATKNKTKYQTYGTNLTLRSIFRGMLRTAAKRGLGFDLTEDDVKQQWEKQDGRCYYSGVQMTLEISDPNKMSIDRVDSTKGYTRDNTVLCAVRVNLMKREMSVEDFLTVVLRISNNNFPMLYKSREGILEAVTQR